MSYIAEMQQKRQAAAEKAAQSSRVKQDEYLAKLNNPNSNIDELGNVIRWFILPAFALWVWYIGYLFTSKELVGVVDDWQVTILAFALPGIVQFLKLYGAKKVLRAYHFKWYDRSGPDMYLWILVGLVVGLMFFWSLKISIWDVKDTARDNYIAQNQDSLSVVIAAATLDIDRQIAAINESNQQAGTMKTRRGKIAWSGQSIQMQNSTTLSALNEQRRQVVEQTVSDYRSKKAQVEKGAAHRGNFFQRFGGFGEVGEILFCLILGLIEAINRNANLARLQHEETQQPVSSRQYVPFHAVNGNGTAQNRSSIGFHWSGYGNASPHARESVSQTMPSVSHDAPPAYTGAFGADELLKHYETVIRREIPNFSNKHARPDTVAGRIHAALDALNEAIAAPGFEPSRAQGARFYGYLVETAFPAINGRGYPYERDTFLAKKLLSVIPQSEQVS